MRFLYHYFAGILSSIYYRRLTPELRRWLSPKVKMISVRLRRVFILMLELRRQYFVVYGKKKNCEIRILYIGRERRLSYILQSAGIEGSDIQKHKKIFLWETGKILRKGMNNNDLTIVEFNPFFEKRARKSGFMLIPEWVSFMKATAASTEPIRRSGSIKENMRRVRKYKYSYEISRDFEKLKFFYYRMYVPYISKRYSSSAHLRNFFSMRSLFRTGLILFVKHNGEYIAGNILGLREKSLTSYCLGILDGDLGYLNKGVISALNYFILEWAGEQKFETVDFGLARAFLNDGVFRFKRTWGMTVKEHEYSTTFWGFRISRFSEGVYSFLEDNPFIFYNNGGLEGFAFLENTSPVGASEICAAYKSFWTQGLSKLNLLSASGFKGEAAESECRHINRVNKDFLSHEHR